MKKNNEMNQDSFFEQSILNKTMVLCLLYQIEDSNRYIEMINIQIKHYQLQINLLKEDYPLLFQKKKAKKIQQQIELLEDKIYEYYTQMSAEIEEIIKIQDTISKIT